jgi:hypothetical protein
VQKKKKTLLGRQMQHSTQFNYINTKHKKDSYTPQCFWEKTVLSVKKDSELAIVDKISDSNAAISFLICATRQAVT